uniref:FA complementation group C n=1 Tax=Salarias fasciatus TaxID=181472 RepID=A0A672GIB1_SALFA
VSGVKESGMQFWLDKAVAWSQADGPDSQRDTCLHLSRLRDFLQQLLTHIHNMSSTAETMQRLPLLGQFLGYLCWNPFVTADGSSRGLLLQCVLGLHSEHPSSAVERKANQWIRVGRGSNYHCSCDVVLATSDACVPLVTYPEASPVVSALLQRPVTCSKILNQLVRHLVCAHINEPCCFSGSLSLEGPALVSLWRRSLSSLEGAVLDLMESSVAAGCTPQIREQQVARSLLVGSFLFLITTSLYVFSSEATCIAVLRVITPPGLSGCVLAEMPREAWRNHLNWLSRSLQRLTEEGEEGDGDGDGVFEAWFLLVQCAHWVQVAVQLLATSGPEDCGLLLWLLTFYHHPTDRWHHRAAQLVQAGEAWDHLLAVFVASPHPAPADRLRSLVALLSPRARNPPPLAPSLTISLLVNFAVFCQLPLSASAGILQTVRKRLVCCLTLTNTLPTPEYLSVRLLIFTSFNYRVAEESITGSHHFLKAFPNCLL